MKIAFISFEFPPDTAIGGIATYVENAALLMAQRGHQVEVFTSSPGSESLNEQWRENIRVHRVHTANRDQFSKLLLPVFTERHRQMDFDIAESPEYSYEGMEVKKKFPGLPMIVRFHTPSFWVKCLNKKYVAGNIKEKLKSMLGIKQYKKEKDKEYLFSLMADGWVVPCTAMKEVLTEYWGLDENKITIIANPFLPSKELLDIPVETNNNRISFIGRLEVRKGVTQLAAAIPLVLAQRPGTEFCFIGKPNHAPGKNGMMDDYLKKQLRSFEQNIRFIPHAPKEKIPELLAQTDICVFPSYWELFGYVCTEAMAAARGIVAGNIGGMKDMLEDINGGVLVDPHSPQEIAGGILFLLNNSFERKEMGKRSREKAMNYYSNKVAAMAEQYYLSKIKKH
ncbi:MAG TPA: glycosyltransferase family 4 protein [Ferruginibacter sp.]|nr:glycosyltransferase family 4 protein [Ferruginibacter sp.]